MTGQETAQAVNQIIDKLVEAGKGIGQPAWQALVEYTKMHAGVMVILLAGFTLLIWLMWGLVNFVSMRGAKENTDWDEDNAAICGVLSVVIALLLSALLAGPLVDNIVTYLCPEGAIINSMLGK